MVIHLIGVISLQPELAVTIISERKKKQTDDKTDEADEEHRTQENNVFNPDILARILIQFILLF